ncbi:tyrosine-type recombinase/integrase [Clostridium estertheticum]|uniref:tyrosine-type recombinase/integrase n=1 Tax=Clostridium estertheticum TaxID=238834 RepID=UPI0035CCCBBB
MIVEPIKDKKKIKLNDSIKTALNTYIKQNKLGHNNYIFRSRKGLNEHITVTQAYRLLKNAAVSIGIENFGTHSLRKTWGYWTYKVSRYRPFRKERYFKRVRKFRKMGNI